MTDEEQYLLSSLSKISCDINEVLERYGACFGPFGLFMEKEPSSEDKVCTLAHMAYLLKVKLLISLSDNDAKLSAYYMSELRDYHLAMALFDHVGEYDSLPNKVLDIIKDLNSGVKSSVAGMKSKRGSKFEWEFILDIAVKLFDENPNRIKSLEHWSDIVITKLKKDKVQEIPAKPTLRKKLSSLKYLIK